MFNPHDYIRDSIEARRGIIEDAKQRGAYAAAAMIGKALGQPRNERAEERLAADLAATDPCPNCGHGCRHEPEESRDGGGRIPAGLVCDWCDWTDREELTAREVRADEADRAESERRGK